jgi:diguanylate cyclase (GGDEF)-like protein
MSSLRSLILNVPPTNAFEYIDQMNAEAWDIRHSDVVKALDIALEILEWSTQHNYHKGQAESLLTQGFCQFRRSDYPLALRNTQAALERFRELEHLQGQQRCLNTLGILHAESGKLLESLKSFLESLKLCEIIKDQEGEGHALNNIAIINSYLGDFYGALDYYFRSLDLSRQTQSKSSEARVLLNIGLVDIELGQYETSLEYYFKSLELQDSEKDIHMRAQTLSNISRTYNYLGKFTEALNYAQQSLSIMESLEDKSGVGYALDELGRGYISLGHLSKADPMLRNSLHIKRETGDPKGHAQTCLLLAELFLKQQDPIKAINILHEALFQMQTIGAKVEIYKLHHALAKAYKLSGQYYEAMSHMEHFSETKEQVFNQASDQRQQALRTRYEVAQAEKEKELFRLKSVELGQLNDELQRLTVELDKQAHQDPLTSLFNRRHFDKEIEREMNRARRFSGKMSVMICDIDNFKKVNDTFSHQVGDQVLAQVATILKDNVRNVDTVARYGGEEFVILFPEITSQESFIICDRLREFVASAPWATIHPELQVTLSMGLCDDLSLLDGDAMIDGADHKMYEAKQNGKNQVRY